MPQVIMNTRYYIFHQNNSHGYFECNEKGMAHTMVIEAINAKHAKGIAKEIGVDFSDGCPCCGDRWGYCSKSELEEESKESLEDIREVNPYEKESIVMDNYASVISYEKPPVFYKNGAEISVEQFIEETKRRRRW